jgi:hypothetical protein
MSLILKVYISLCIVILFGYIPIVKCGCSTAYGTIDENGHLTVPNTVTSIAECKFFPTMKHVYPFMFYESY